MFKVKNQHKTKQIIWLCFLNNIEDLSVQVTRASWITRDLTATAHNL